MNTRPIGSLKASIVGLGCNNFGGRLDLARTKDVLDAAIDSGVTFLDTADIYGATDSERFMGEALKGRRDQVVLATKFGHPSNSKAPKGARPEDVRAALEGSLQRLRTDHIDLYQLHFPDADVPVADTLGALAEAVREGKVREIGCSNFSAAQLREAEDAAQNGAPRFVSVQNEYSMLKRDPEQEVLPACDKLDLAFLPYFPLVSGILTGKYRKGRPMPEGARITGSARWEAKLTDGVYDLVERAHRVRRGARQGDPRPRLRVPAGAPARGERHRRRHLARAGAPQRTGRQLAAHRRRARGGHGHPRRRR